MPKLGGGRVAVLEILKSTMRTRDYIEQGEREGKTLLDAIKDGGLDVGVMVIVGLGGDRFGNVHVADTIDALNDMSRRMHREPSSYYRELAAIFMHRPCCDE